MRQLVQFALIVAALFVLIGTTFWPLARGITLGLDLQGGFELLYKIEPHGGGPVTTDLLRQTETVLANRINVLGVAEPLIEPEPPDRIRIQLPGVTNVDEARQMLAAEAHLAFRHLVLDDKGNVVEESPDLLTGADLKEGAAKVVFSDRTTAPMVSLTVKDPKKLEAITRSIPHGDPKHRLAIFLDDRLISAPMVNATITNGQAVIEGMADVEEARRLAGLLNAGALPVKLVELSYASVSPTLGQAALFRGIEAGVAALLFIAVFMLAVYRLPGFVAVVTLLAYVYLVFFFLWGIRVTLTLPGIAALILGMGMAVDANIITDERIKDELRSGKSIPSAVKAGSRRSLMTILDAHVTTLIAGIVLFIMGGASAIRGFAVIHILSTVLNLITNVGLARLLLHLLVRSGRFDRPAFFGVREREIRAA
ncbi:MAG: protein translocase subunit SecD [Hydrogenibacillus schlegelii]|nr:protein translocase subunit SecD [Hydrogenibacillus schlegelii]